MSATQSPVLVLSADDVERLLDLEGCVDAMREALLAVARGEVCLPLRSVVRPPGEDSLIGLMPVHRGGRDRLYALKTTCIFPGNSARGLDPHQGSVALFDGETGQLRTLVNASAVTALRTAAVSVLASRALAREDAEVCAIVGAGHQARAHGRALKADGRFRRIVVAARRADAARALASELDVDAAPTIEDAVRAADVVCTVTSSTEPVVSRAWLRHGAHVNAVGACFPAMRELDSETIADAAVFVDRRESAEREAGDLLVPIAEGAIGPDHVCAELGEVLAGTAPGRTSSSELTVFESLGLAVEDLAAAEYAERRARETGAGVEVSF